MRQEEPLRQLTVRMPVSLWRAFKAACVEDDRTMQEVVADVIAQQLKARKPVR